MVFATTEELYGTLERLFAAVAARDVNAAAALEKSGLVIRFVSHEPTGIVTVDGGKRPFAVHFGESEVKPKLTVMLPTDLLHQILLGEVALTKALGSGRLKVKGPIWKMTALSGILDGARSVYPEILQQT